MDGFQCVLITTLHKEDLKAFSKSRQMSGVFRQLGFMVHTFIFIYQDRGETTSNNPVWFQALSGFEIDSSASSLLILSSLSLVDGRC